MNDRPQAIEGQQYLSGVDYPASRDELLRVAREHGADAEAIAVLEGIPDREYEGPTEVSEAIAG